MAKQLPFFFSAELLIISRVLFTILFNSMAWFLESFSCGACYAFNRRTVSLPNTCGRSRCLRGTRAQVSTDGFRVRVSEAEKRVDAQDVTQEVFLRAYRNLYGLRHPHRFRSWLYAIMSNECNRWLARAAKTRRHEVQLAQSSGNDLRVEPAHTVPTEGWTVDLEQAISTLSEENRVAVSMFYMGDCSLKEISEFLGVSVNTVKTKLHRARQQLGTALSEHYGRLLKSHKLKGGFLMQFMEQIRHIPAPTVGFAWSGATIGKTVFSLITVLCVLIGLIGASDDLPIELSTHQIGQTASGTSLLPIEVALLESAPSLARSPISGMPVAMGKNPINMLSSDPTEASGRLVERRVKSAANGAKPANRNPRRLWRITPQKTNLFRSSD